MVTFLGLVYRKISVGVAYVECCYNINT